MLPVRRDASGTLTQILPNGASGERRESMIYLELERADAKIRREIADEIESVLADVRAAVSDWGKLQDAMRAAADSLPDGEGAALMRWFVDRHFTLLGHQSLARDGTVSEGLGVLRGDETGDGRAPLGVRDIPALVDSERVHGADVTFDESADLGRLPPSQGLAAYRIVQEALTNARVHGAPGNRTRVSITRERGLLTVVVEDTAPAGWASQASPLPRGGRGILGMRERAAIHGGTLEARRTPGGFRVTAGIPIPEER